MEKELKRLSESALALAKTKGFEDVSLYCDWDGFVVFEAKQYDPNTFKEPQFVLASNKEVRWANNKELSDIIIYYEQPHR